MYTNYDTPIYISNICKTVQLINKCTYILKCMKKGALSSLTFRKLKY